MIRLFGDYESLTGGKARDAMVDMTGGVGEGIEIRDYRTQDEKMKLFKILNHAMDDRSLMSASITVSVTDHLKYTDAFAYDSVVLCFKHFN